jgi:hypothetical protein
MQTMSLITITAEQALQLLHGVGFMISREMLVRGMEQGQFPFGTVIDTGNERRSFVYLALLERFIEDRLYPDIVPEVPTEEVTS